MRALMILVVLVMAAGCMTRHAPGNAWRMDGAQPADGTCEAACEQ